MATALVSIDSLERGELPPVCAKTGDRAATLVPMDFFVGPNWTWVFLFVGVVPFLVALLFMRRDKVKGLVPLSARYLSRMHTIRIAGVGAAAAGLLLLGAASRWGPVGVVQLSLLLLAAGVVTTLVGFLPPVSGRVDVVHRQVQMHRVHPRFAAAADAASASRPVA